MTTCFLKAGNMVEEQMAHSRSIDDNNCNAPASKDIIEIITQKIYDNLNVYYDDIERSSAKICGVSLSGQFAHTFKFTITDNSRERLIFGKVCPVYEFLNPAQQEYETLIYLYEHMNKTEGLYAVSRPLDYYPEINAYIMESVGTQDLRSYLLKNNSIFSSEDRVSSLKEKIAGSARWLAEFHNVSKSEKHCVFNYEDYMQTFQSEFDYNELKKFRFGSGVIEEIDKTFSALSEIADNLVMPCAKQHWDYTPGHVYLDDNKISVIDILGVDDVPIYEDIGHFLASITSINNLPMYPFFNYKRVRNEFCDEFLDAYLNRSALKKDEFLLLCNIYRLKYLVVYFLGQYRLIGDKLNYLLARIYINYRVVNIFEVPFLQTIREIRKLLPKTIKSASINNEIRI